MGMGGCYQDMSTLKNHQIQECIVCGVFTTDGRNVERTAGTEKRSDFYCRNCNWERLNLLVVERAADQRLTKN